MNNIVLSDRTVNQVLDAIKIDRKRSKLCYSSDEDTCIVENIDTGESIMVALVDSRIQVYNLPRKLKSIFILYQLTGVVVEFTLVEAINQFKPGLNIFGLVEVLYPRALSVEDICISVVSQEKTSEFTVK